MKFPISIPTYKTETDEWTYTEFKTRDEFKGFVWSKFKPPGEVKLYNTSSWRLQASKFEEEGKYDRDLVWKSKDWVDYWENEKEKCTKGVIVDDFFLSSYYYFWINFLKINDKRTNSFNFPAIYDSQYYYALYIQLCELEYKYSVVLKKRQWGGTFQHLAILINDIWFKKGYINKIAAADEEFIKADWAMVEEYRNFLNEHTAWTRQFSPDKTFNWQQRWETKNKGRKIYVGNQSILKGINLKISPSKGVGGKNNKFYYEEAGITKTMDITFGYIDPALKYGAETTGMFMASGSVGELEQCEALKKIVYRPAGFNVLPIKNTFSENSDLLETCFFVPEYWSMSPYIDADGNSQIEEAKTWCLEEREKKETSSPEQYRLYISQHPFDVEEAFAWRKEAIFPQVRLINQQERIMAEKIQPMLVNLEYDDTGKIRHEICNDCKDITKFPLGDKDLKEGAIRVFEFPDPKAPFFTYFAGVDPVNIDKTTTSKSLFSIYIFKNVTEESYKDGEDIKIKVDGFNMVASYTGRYEDLVKTNEIAEKLIVWYNALAAVENNSPSFINHMQQQGLQKYLASRDQLSFVSELKTNIGVHSPWGFFKNEKITDYFVDIIYDYITEKLDVLTKSNSDEVVKTVYGVERIPDWVLLEELKQYNDKINVDRFVAFAAGLALMKSFRKYNIGVRKVNNIEPEQEKKPSVSMPRSFFKNYGMSNNNIQKVKRSYFKNYK